MGMHKCTFQADAIWMTYFRLGQLYAELDQDVEVSGDVEVLMILEYCLMQLQIEQPVVDKQVCIVVIWPLVPDLKRWPSAIVVSSLCVWIMFMVDMRSFETPWDCVCLRQFNAWGRGMRRSCNSHIQWCACVPSYMFIDVCRLFKWMLHGEHFSMSTLLLASIPMGSLLGETKVDPYNLDSLLALGVSCTNELDQLPALLGSSDWIQKLLERRKGTEKGSSRERDWIILDWRFWSEMAIFPLKLIHNDSHIFKVIACDYMWWICIPE